MLALLLILTPILIPTTDNKSCIHTDTNTNTFTHARTNTRLVPKFLHDLGILSYQNSQGIRYLGSCRIFKNQCSSAYTLNPNRILTICIAVGLNPKPGSLSQVPCACRRHARSEFQAPRLDMQELPVRVLVTVTVVGRIAVRAWFIVIVIL